MKRILACCLNEPRVYTQYQMETGRHNLDDNITFFSFMLELVYCLGVLIRVFSILTSSAMSQCPIN